jgi:murein DD-endopeptidase MepM/ murein hydrolase activator NlpD
VQIYETGEPDLVSVVLDAHGFADLLEQTEFMQRISHQDTQIIDAVVTAKAQATASAKRLAGLEEKETQVTAQIQSRRDQVANVKLGLQGTQDKLAGYRAQKQRLLASTVASRHHLEDDVASLRSEQRKIEARLASTSGPAVAGPIRQGSGGLIWPVNGPITSTYGPRRINGRYEFHPGVDIGVPTGTPIRAAAAGIVTIAGTEGGYGNYTCVDHGGGLSTCYGHQERILVSVGEHVAQAQIIGLSDCTGYCFGPHVHFEVRINGQTTDPLGYL